jgi:hypothetical protein
MFKNLCGSLFGKGPLRLLKAIELQLGDKIHCNNWIMNISLLNVFGVIVMTIFPKNVPRHRPNLQKNRTKTMIQRNCRTYSQSKSKSRWWTKEVSLGRKLQPNYDKQFQHLGLGRKRAKTNEL